MQSLSNGVMALKGNPEHTVTHGQVEETQSLRKFPWLVSQPKGESPTADPLLQGGPMQNGVSSRAPFIP